MTIISGTLVVILLVAAVVVNTLDVYEDSLENDRQQNQSGGDGNNNLMYAKEKKWGNYFLKIICEISFKTHEQHKRTKIV